MVRYGFNTDNTITLRLAGGTKEKCRKIGEFKYSVNDESHIVLSPIGTDRRYIYRYRKGEDYIELGSLEDGDLRKVSEDFENQLARRAAAELAARKRVQAQKKSAGGSLLKGVLKFGAALAIGDIVGDILEGDEIGLDIFEDTSSADISNAAYLADISFDGFDFGGGDMSGVSFGDYDFNGDGLISGSEFQAATGDWMNSVDNGSI